MSLPVFLGKELRPHPTELSAGQTAVLTGTEAHHAATVRRIKTGERIDVVDGEGIRLTCTVISSSREELKLQIDAVDLEPVPVPSFVLVQALAKGKHDEQAITVATEVGVDHIIPWQADRSVAVWKGTRAAKGQQKWESVVVAAAKQSRRARIPVVDELMRTAELIQYISQQQSQGNHVFLLHEEASVGLMNALVDGDLPRPIKRVSFIVGPEGGIGTEETALLTDAGAIMVRLGPTVLRSATAGPVAIAVLGAHLGRWEVRVD